MAYEIFLAPLWDVPSRSNELSDRLRTAALAAVPRDDGRWLVDETSDGALEIAMPLAVATIERDHATLRLRGISPEVVRLIYTIAKEAEVAIVNAGGHPGILLVDPAHIDLLSPGIRSQDPVLCGSASELMKLLSPNFDLPTNEMREASRRRNLLYSKRTRDHVTRSIGKGDPDPNLPGLVEPRDTRPIYVEIKPKEGSLLRRFSRFIRDRIKANQGTPEGGGARGSDWEIRLPTGQVFRCLHITGYSYKDRLDSPWEWRERRIEQQIEIVNDFARATGRRTGVIVDGNRFTLSDGSSYPLLECESRRATDDTE